MSRKNKQNEYEQSQRNLNNSSKAPTAFDKIIFEELEDSDERVAELVQLMRSGCPLVINFDQLDEFAANKMLAFLTGATFASDGNIIKIKERVFLFARKIDFADTTLSTFIEQYGL